MISASVLKSVTFIMIAAFASTSSFAGGSGVTLRNAPPFEICGDRVHFDGGSIWLPNGYTQISGDNRVRFSFSGSEILDIRIGNGTFKPGEDPRLVEETKDRESAARVFSLRGTRAPVFLLVYQATVGTWVQVSATNRVAAETLFETFSVESFRPGRCLVTE